MVLKADGTIIKAKSIDEKKAAMQLVMQQPDVANKIMAVAATLNDVFNKYTKILVDMRPGAAIKDTHTLQVYTYAMTIQPFPHDMIAELVFEQAKFPLEEFDEISYILLRKGNTLEEGELFMMSSRDFVKYFAIKRFEIVTFNKGDEDSFADKYDLSKGKEYKAGDV